MRTRKWLVAGLAAGLLAGMLGMALASGSGNGKSGQARAGGSGQGKGQGGGQGKGQGSGQSGEHGTHPHTPVLICHRTHSADNPSVPIVTDDDAVVAHHDNHADDQIFYDNVPAPNDKDAQRAMCGAAAPGPGGEPPGGSVPSGGKDPGSGDLTTPPPLTG